MSRMRCSSLRRNVSTCSTPLTWMPAAATSVSEASRRGVAHRKLGRDPAAEREADQIDVVEIELIEEIEIEVGEVGDVVEPVRRVGGAEARMLGHDHVVARGEVRHVGQPASRAAGAVQDQERAAGAAAHQADVAAADGEFRRCGIGHCTTRLYFRDHTRYLSWSATLAIAPLAQSSSPCWPPVVPLTPIAPITSLPTLIGMPPPSGMTSARLR